MFIVCNDVKFSSSNTTRSTINITQLSQDFIIMIRNKTFFYANMCNLSLAKGENLNQTEKEKNSCFKLLKLKCGRKTEEIIILDKFKHIPYNKPKKFTAYWKKVGWQS